MICYEEFQCLVESSLRTTTPVHMGGGSLDVMPTLRRTTFKRSYLLSFSINVYDLLDTGATLSYVTPLVARKFDILPGVLI